ncbi:hypothetical protein [Macrococcoides caseolyticum]|uniref:hypothetical protein n=1 Tax=Macrococcoides caseolyticum TaxID=69966 RepID=UPI00140939B3|nr:hypothetical protein [Macrococcus caseolyticus]
MNNLMSVMGVSAITMGTYLCAEAVTEVIILSQKNDTEAIIGLFIYNIFYIV